MEKKGDFKSNQFDTSEVYEEIKSIDTSKYKSHPMVEKLLVNQVEEFKKEIIELRKQILQKNQENNDLKVNNAILKERKFSNNILEWVRNITGIAMGISGGLLFSKDKILDKIGSIATPLLFIAFLIIGIVSFFRDRKSEN